MDKQECEQLCHKVSREISKRLDGSRQTLNKLVEHSNINENVIEFFNELVSSVFGKSDTTVVLTHSSRNYLYNTSSSTWIVSNDRVGFKMVITLTTYMSLCMSPIPRLLKKLTELGWLKPRTDRDLKLKAKVNYVLSGYLGTKKVWDITDIVRSSLVRVHSSAWIHDANETRQRVEKYENEWREWYFGKNRNAR